MWVHMWHGVDKKPSQGVRHSRCAPRQRPHSPKLPPVGHACPGAGLPCSAASAKGPVPGNLALLAGVWLAGEAPRLRLATAGRLMPKAPGAGGAVARPPYSGLHSGTGCWPLFALVACCCMPVEITALLPWPGAGGQKQGALAAEASDYGILGRKRRCIERDDAQCSQRRRLNLRCRCREPPGTTQNPALRVSGCLFSPPAKYYVDDVAGSWF